MEQYLQFVTKHWLLWSILAIIFILLIIEELRSKSGGFRISPQDAVLMINHDNAVVIDIRDKAAYSASHITGAISMLQSELETQLAKTNKYKDKPIIIVCSTGQSSQIVANRLRKQGVNKAHCIIGGTQAWKSTGLPLTKSRS